MNKSIRRPKNERTSDKTTTSEFKRWLNDFTKRNHGLLKELAHIPK